MAVMTVSYNEGFLACSYGEFICIYKIGKFRHICSNLRILDDNILVYCISYNVLFAPIIINAAFTIL